MNATQSNLKEQQWQMHPGNERDIVNGELAAARLLKYGIIKAAEDLLQFEVGSVLKTGVSAYERIS